MVKVLNTTGLNTQIENIISEAYEKLAIICPYIKLPTRLENILLEKQNSDIEFTVVYGKDYKIDLGLKETINSFKRSSLLHDKTLHAKIYMNENYTIITSMNLYYFSQINNYEIGVLIEKNE